MWRPVRISLPGPPLALAKAFSRSGGDQIFPCFQRGLRSGLNTSSGASGLESVLSGMHSPKLMTAPIWCTACKSLGCGCFLECRVKHFDAGGTRLDGTEIERSPLQPFAAAGPKVRVAGQSTNSLRLRQRPHSDRSGIHYFVLLFKQIGPEFRNFKDCEWKQRAQECRSAKQNC